MPSAKLSQICRQHINSACSHQLYAARQILNRKLLPGCGTYRETPPVELAIIHPTAALTPFTQKHPQLPDDLLVCYVNLSHNIKKLKLNSELKAYHLKIIKPKLEHDTTRFYRENAASNEADGAKRQKQHRKTMSVPLSILSIMGHGFATQHAAELNNKSFKSQSRY